MVLDFKLEHTDYNRHIFPYMRKVFLDTSVMKIFIDGFIRKTFSSQTDYEYDNLIALLEKLKLKEDDFQKQGQLMEEKIKWNKFWITPQILTEICHHFYCNHNHRGDFRKIIEKIIPIFKEMNEKMEISKAQIIKFIEDKTPIIELGDFSIFIAVDDITKNGEKISILAKDRGIKSRFENYPNVLMIDYDKAILSMY